MKKSIVFSLIASAFLMGACSKETGFIVQKAPELELFTKEISEVEFGQSVEVAGTVKSPNAVRDISFYLVKKVDGGYERLWFSPLQYADIVINKEVTFSTKVSIDDPEADAIAISTSDPYSQSITEYIPIGNIIGSPSGSAYVFRNMEMAAEYEHAADQPSVFSVTGVNVNGSLKNVLSINQAKAAKATNIDLSFINIWRNTTTFTSGVLGNWGYAFCEFRQLARGPVGRQCDFVSYHGSTSIPSGIDTCCVVLVSPAVAESNNFDKVFEHAADNFGTSNFLNLLQGLFSSNAIGNAYYVPFKLNGASTNTNAVTTQVVKGTYLAIRKTINKNQHTYGLIRILDFADDSDIIISGSNKYQSEEYEDDVVSNANLPKFWFNSSSVKADGIAKLYGRKVKFDLVMQKQK